MARNEVFLERCRRSMLEEPERVLVLLWRHLLRSHGSLEEGFDRPRQQEAAASALEALKRNELPPKVHPLAALSACDSFLASLDRGLRSRPRRVTGESGAEYYLLPRRAGWKSRHAEQPGNLAFWAPHYQVVPVQHKGIAVEVRSPAPRRLVRGLNGARIPFLAGGFEDGVLPNWSKRSPKRCSCLIDDGGRRWRSIEELLGAASRSGAAIVVLPELTVDSGILFRLRRWLHGERRSHGLCLVVAGSFHVEGSAKAEGRRPRHNVAWVLDAYGREVFRHTKLRPFRTEQDGALIEEDIEGAARVELLHLDFGLLGVAICLDFCEEGQVPVKELWSEVEPALMLVPSMGGKSTLSAHQRKAEALARQCGAVTVVASQHPARAEGVGLRWDADRSKPDRDSPLLQGVISWPGWRSG